MEALLFLINSLVIVVMVFQGLRDDRRAAGAPATSIFRTRDLTAARKAIQPMPDTQEMPPDPWDLPIEGGPR